MDCPSAWLLLMGPAARGQAPRDSSLTAKGEAERLTAHAFFKARCSKPFFPFRTSIRCSFIWGRWRSAGTHSLTSQVCWSAGGVSAVFFGRHRFGKARLLAGGGGRAGAAAGGGG